MTISGSIAFAPAAGPPKVAVVLATYNRRVIVLRCLELLRKQTRLPEKICVVDNGSSDGTSAEIRRVYAANEGIDLIDLPENLGNAGGIRLAMEKAIDTGADAIWILDDDAWPRADALEKLLPYFQKDVVCSSLVLDPEKNDLAWACVVASPRALVVGRVADLPEEKAFEVRGAWLGALVPRIIIEAVGFPDAGFFIRGEDEEYPARIVRGGYRFLCVRDSVVEHPAPNKNLRFQLFGMNIFYEPGLAPWKAYYIVRNRAYLHRKFASSWLAGFFKAWASVFFSIIMAVAIDDRKVRRAVTYFKAGWRGAGGRLGDESRPG